MKAQLNSQTLHKLANADGKFFLSLLAPMQRAGREVRQNEIRWKNVLKEARQLLLDREISSDEIDSLLQPATEKLVDDLYWQHQLDGLAFYVSEDEYVEIPISASLQQQVVVANRFHLRPLLPHANRLTRCYVLATSSNRVRLLEVNGDSIEDLQPEMLPENLRDALNIDEYVSALQFHSTSIGSGKGKQAVAFHGHGGSDPDVKKQDEILQFFHRLNDSLSQFFRSEDVPLMFAGVDFLFPIFRKACHYRNLLDEHVSGNLDNATPKMILQLARPVLESLVAAENEIVISKFQQKSHSEWASDDPETIFSAAKMGQVETLILSDEYAEQGVVSDDDTLQITAAESVDSYDVGNLILIEVLRNGGSAVQISSDQMPSQTGVSAVFRSPVGEQVGNR